MRTFYILVMAIAVPSATFGMMVMNSDPKMSVCDPDGHFYTARGCAQQRVFAPITNWLWSFHPYVPWVVSVCWVLLGAFIIAFTLWARKNAIAPDPSEATAVTEEPTNAQLALAEAVEPMEVVVGIEDEVRFVNGQVVWPTIDPSADVVKA